MKSRTRYVRNGSVYIAYQVVGEGPLDLVFVPGWVSHVEQIWEEPNFAHFLAGLARFSRLILMDRRGTGLSDPVSELPTLEERMEDVRAVMDAAGSERAALVGVSEGGPMCTLFAATYPERTGALVLIGTYASLRRDAQAPWAISDEAGQRFLDRVSLEWGQGLSARLFAPSLKEDAAFIARFGRLERFAVGPGAARRLLEVAFETDVRGVLSSVRVPTLVIHRTGDRATPVEGGRYLAEQIQGARLVELPGADHFPYIGNAERILSEVEHFLTGARRGPEVDRVLATVLFSDIADSTRRLSEIGDRAWAELLGRFYALVHEEMQRFRGVEIDRAGDGHLATFDGPARAIRCAASLRERVAELGLSLRQGLHTGECERVGDRLGGFAVHLGARIAGAARPGEILVSSTVKELVVGSSLSFEDRGLHALKGVPGEWQLHAATL